MQLISRKYHPVTSGDVLGAVDQGRLLPRDAVLVTVDDGYRDFLEVVFPIVKRYGIQPVLFISTLYIERGMFWWDRLAWAMRNTQVTAIETPIGPISLGTEAEREGASYVSIGPIFPTSTKPDAGRPLGLRAVAEAKRRVRIPLVAIGGINAENVAQVVRAGADAVAVVSAVCFAPDPEGAAEEMARRIEEARG